MKEVERARAIYRYALDHIPKAQVGALARSCSPRVPPHPDALIILRRRLSPQHRLGAGSWIDADDSSRRTTDAQLTKSLENQGDFIDNTVGWRAYVAGN